MQKITKKIVIAVSLVVSFSAGLVVSQKIADPKSKLSNEFVVSSLEANSPDAKKSNKKKKRVSRSACVQNILDTLEDIAYQVLTVQERGAQIDKNILCRIHELLVDDRTGSFAGASLDQLREIENILVHYRADLDGALLLFDRLLFVVQEKKS